MSSPFLQTFALTNPTLTEIFPSPEFLVTPSDFTMSLYLGRLGRDAPDTLTDPTDPMNPQVYLEDVESMMAGKVPIGTELDYFMLLNSGF